MNTLWQDLRYGLRMLARNPGFTAVAVLTLALGIGANSTIFSWINSTLLNPIPGAQQTSGLFSLTRGGTATNPIVFSYPDYLDLREHSRSFSGLMAFGFRPMDLTGISRPERIWSTLATANYFEVLGIQPVIGRGFLPSEDEKPGGAPVVLLGYSFWQTHFGGDRSVLGRTLQINHHPFTIVGVTPPAFQGSMTGLRSDLWIPMMMEEQVAPGGDRLHRRSSDWLMVMGRLAPGVTRQQAQQEMNLQMQRIVEEFPDSHPGRNQVTLHPLWQGPHSANAYLCVFLPVLMALAGVVLILACANVANLLVVRSMARQREISIRLSVGASRGHLVRQFLVESFLLALAGGVGAALLTVWTAGTFARFVPPTDVPLSLAVHMDRRVLLVTLALSLLTGLIFGILPALRSSRLAPASVLKDEASSTAGGLHKAHLASGLVVAQISLSLLLLIAAGLFIRGFQQVRRFSPGFNPSHVLLASFDLFPAGYSREGGREFERQLQAKLASLPGIQSVTLASWVPLGFMTDGTAVVPEGYVPETREPLEIRVADVGPNYLHTLEIPLLGGRDFGPQDTERSQRVAVINQTMADRFWPHQDVLGKRLQVYGEWFNIVGVTPTGSYDRLGELPQAFFYLPLSQDYDHRITIHARVVGDPLAYAAVIEKTVHELNADLPVFDVTPLSSRVEFSSTNLRIAATFVGAFGLLALLLATVGIYGVVAFTTRQRTHEIGIRMALGAQKPEVLQLVLSHGLRLTLVGLGLGVVGAFGLTRFLASLLFGVSTHDPLTFAAVVSLLGLVALVACYIPARRATKVDPMVALRYE